MKYYLVYIMSFFLAFSVYAMDNFEEINFNDLPENIKEMVNSEEYYAQKGMVSGTSFNILFRKNSPLPAKKIKASIQKFWPIYTELFNLKVSSANVIDYNAPAGGGPMGSFSIGIYSSKNISNEIADYIESSLGWKPQDSTKSYIEEQYASFSNPIEAYIDDIIVHELGHLIFGFGLSRIPSLQDKTSWFSLGLGILYDRIIWDRFYKQKSPIIDSLVSLWQNKFKNISEIDQRLINPNTSIDDHYNLIRLQVYGHGKSYSFLKELRKRTGEKYFDLAVKNYLNSLLENESEYINYSKFLDFLFRVNSIVKQVEDEFIVR